MKPVTVDMLRAHLMAASLTAMCAEALASLALLVLPISPHAFSSTPFRLFALGSIIGGVVAMRYFAQVSFGLAIRSRHASSRGWTARPVSVAASCPRRWLVILHLRFTGRPFVLAEH
ncbi:hypothetical protein [Paraburkholderia lacunae]|uniref:Uncharacterized protein n=1 Tax=Paraburkholderia lacunae TaxID=2211104 RepID=A0A370N094_9BURK|nr:hypothetical protein [Paraburkholderia lacunae]RDJ99038.1 hypothetical protein DLM46_30055 [Paraburkholderia lacunae]